MGRLLVFRGFVGRFFICACIFCFPLVGLSQKSAKSKAEKVIDGKKYLMHTVAKHQTLYAISKLYHLSVNDIVVENPDAIDGIKPGEVLKIPTVVAEKKKTPAPLVKDLDSGQFVFHSIQPGETFYAISKQYKVSIEALKACNPQVEQLKLNDVLKIPLHDKVAKGNAKGKVMKPLEAKPVVVEAGIKIDSACNKKSYGVAVLLPFHCDEYQEMTVDNFLSSGTLDLSTKTEVAIQFYQGLRLAVDSLNAKGMNCKIYAMDVDELDSAQIDNLLHSPTFKNIDLIIGPFYLQAFSQVAKFAKAHAIAICAPFIQQNKILFNNNLISKVLSSGSTQCEQLCTYFKQHYKGDHVLIVNSGSAKDQSSVKAIVANLAGKDSALEVNGFLGVQKELKLMLRNIVFVPTSNQAFVTDLLTKLNSLKDRYAITVFGMQGWNEFENIDLDYFNNLNFHFETNQFIDYSNIGTKQFQLNYFNAFGTDPTVYAMEGFDIGLYYLGLLKEKGACFYPQLLTKKFQGVLLNFDFGQVSAESGFENKSNTLVEYRDFKLVKVVN